MIELHSKDSMNSNDPSMSPAAALNLKLFSEWFWGSVEDKFFATLEAGATMKGKMKGKMKGNGKGKGKKC